jgi:hypothetical protein
VSRLQRGPAGQARQGGTRIWLPGLELHEVTRESLYSAISDAPVRRLDLCQDTRTRDRVARSGIGAPGRVAAVNGRYEGHCSRCWRVSSGTPPWCSSAARTVRRTNGPSIAANQSGSASRKVQVSFEPRRNGVPQHCICQLSTQTVMIMNPILTAARGHVEAFHFFSGGIAGKAHSHAAILA